MKKIKWLTKDYIQRQGQKSKKDALICSMWHWEQLKTAGPKTLQKAYESRSVSLCSSFCALCKHYWPTVPAACKRNCVNCIEVWKKAHFAFKKWEYKPTRTNWKKWKIAANGMYEHLNKYYQKWYGVKNANRNS